MPRVRAPAVSALAGPLALTLSAQAAQRVQTQSLGGEWAIFLDRLVKGGALFIGVDDVLPC